MNLEQIGEDCKRLIKQAYWFPYDKGNLRGHATKGEMITTDTYEIKF